MRAQGVAIAQDGLFASYWRSGVAHRIIHERFERLGAFVSKTVGAGRFDRTKNAAQANNRARRP